MLLVTAALALGALADERLEAFDEQAFSARGDDRSVLVHATLTAGAIGVGPGNPTDYGPMVALGVPLFLGRRHRHLQWVLDSHFSVSYGASSDRLFFTLTPTAGGNFYFLGWLGFEFRVGVALGLRWTARAVALGLAYVLETAVVVRPFEDDHLRLKLAGMGQELIPFSNAYRATVSATLGLGLELRL